MRMTLNPNPIVETHILIYRISSRRSIYHAVSDLRFNGDPAP